MVLGYDCLIYILDSYVRNTHGPCSHRFIFILGLVSLNVGPHDLHFTNRNEICAKYKEKTMWKKKKSEFQQMKIERQNFLYKLALPSTSPAEKRAYISEVGIILKQHMGCITEGLSCKWGWEIIIGSLNRSDINLLYITRLVSLWEDSHLSTPSGIVDRLHLHLSY